MSESHSASAERGPDLPVASWPKTVRCVARLYRALSSQALSGQLLDRRVAPQIVSAVVKTFPADVPRSAISATIEQFFGRTLDEHLILTLCWQLGGNLPRLKQGRFVGPWSSQSEPEWVPMRVIRVQRQRHPRRKILMYRVTGWVWSGSAVTCELTRVLTAEACRMVARRVGFSSRRGHYPYRAPEELYGMHFFGLLEPEVCLSVRPRYTRIAISEALKNINRRLLAIRSRVRPLGKRCRPFSCPLGLPNSVPCYRCPLGEDRCPAACRPLSLNRGVCSICFQENWFDPLDNLDGPVQCIACRFRGTEA